MRTTPTLEDQRGVHQMRHFITHRRVQTVWCAIVEAPIHLELATSPIRILRTSPLIIIGQPSSAPISVKELA